MPNWKKLIVSGSDATLNSLNVITSITGSDIKIDDWGSVSGSLANLTDSISIGVDGSGTANYISKWSDTDTLTDSIIYDDGTNVGIGTDSPSTYFKLDVNGSANFLSDIQVGRNATALSFDMNPGYDSGNYYLSLHKNQTNDGGVLLYSKPTSGGAQLDWQISNQGTTGDLKFYAFGLTGDAFVLDRETGYLQLPEYGAGTLVSDASGNITVSSGGGAGGPYLPLTAGSSEILTGDLAMNNNIGIITKDSSGAFRDVLKLNSSNVLEIGSSSLTTDAIFKNTGNVGIGTTSPGEKLVVDGKIRALGGTSSVDLYHQGNNALLVNNGTGNIRFWNNGSERMRITSNGNVGIGTTSIIAADGLLKISAPSGNGQSSSISLYGNNGNLYGGSNVVRSRITSLSDGTAFGAELTFSTNDTSNVVQERMRIDSAGNVSIGTTSPDFKLDVDGTFGVSDLSFNTDSVSVLVADETIASEIITNGGFDTDLTDWINSSSYPWTSATWTSSGVSLQTSGNAQYKSFYQDIGPITSGKTYKISYSAVKTSGTMYVGVETSPVGSTVGYQKTLTSSEVVSEIFTATTTDATCVISFWGQNDSSTNEWVIDNVSIKEVTSASNQIQKRELGTGAFGPTPVGAYLPLSAGSDFPLTGELYVNSDISSSGDLYLDGAFYDTSNQPGTLGQILSSTNTGTDWIDADAITAASAESIKIAVKNTSGAIINAGTPVYETGTVGATETLTVSPADASDSAKMPAIGIITTTLNNNGQGYVIVTGIYKGITTDPIDGVTPTANTTLYVKAGGGLTTVKPTGSTNLIQNVGKVGKVSGGSSGSIVVSSIMRSNDVPNLPEGRIWVGDGNTITSSTVYLDETNERMGIGTTIPDSKLHIESTTSTGANLILETTHAGGIPLLDLKGAHSAQLRYKDELDVIQGRIDFGDSGTFNFIDVPNNSSTLYLKTGGNVGIGTTSPGAKLEVRNNDDSQTDTLLYIAQNPTTTEASVRTAWLRGETSAEAVRIDNYGSGDALIVGEGNVGIGTDSPKSILTTTGVISIVDTQTALVLDTEVAGLDFYTSDPSFASSSTSKIARIFPYSDSSVGQGFGLKFSTSPDDTDAEVKMTIDKAGNVGIGTTSPDARLHVDSSTAFSLTDGSADTLLLTNNSTVSAIGAIGPSIGFGNMNTDKRTSAIAAIRTGDDHDNMGLAFFTHPSDSNNETVVQKMTITHEGNVGIGTTSPNASLQIGNAVGTSSEKLDVRGNSSANYVASFEQDHNTGYGVLIDTDGTLVSEPVFKIKNTSSELFYVGSNGNVGIGTNNPGEELEVIGQVKATSLNSPFLFSQNADLNIVGGGGQTNFTRNQIQLTNGAGTIINAPTGKEVVLKSGGLTTLTLDSTQNATFAVQAFSTTATSTGDISSTLTTKGYVDSLITGATIYRGAWDPDVSLNSGYGSPDLSSVTQTSGYYYICSADGAATPNGLTTEPNTWNTGDWVIWNDDIGTAGEWQKIDNSSVLSGVGTGQTVALWQGANSVTDSETLGNAPITVSGNDTTFAGSVAVNGTNVTVANATNPYIYLNDTNAGAGIFQQSGNDTRIGSDSDTKVVLVQNNTTAVTIDTDKNVGIGETNPLAKLHVSDSSFPQVRINDDENFGESGIRFRSSDVNNLDFHGDIFVDGTGDETGRMGFRVPYNGTEKLTILHGGNVGINNTSPVNGKLVVDSDTNTLLNTVRINHTRSDSNIGSQALFLDVNLSGADNTTADRTHTGLTIDLDSSANGDASHEHRIRGVNSDVRFSGFSDNAQSVYGYAESNYTSAKTAQLIGVIGSAVHDSSATTGGVSNMYGVYGASGIQDLGDVDNAFGGYFAVEIGTARGNADVGVTKGVEGHINIDKASTINYGAMMAVSGIIDNNEGAVPNFGDQYLFKGDYQGTKGNNAWGIYTEGDKHYFEGKVGIGTTVPGSLLHVEGSITQAALQINQTGTGVIANFKQGGNSKVIIDNSGRVGIGISTITANTSADDLQIGNGTGARGLTITAQSNSGAAIYFGDSDDTDIGSVRYDNSNDSMKFFTNTSEKMRIKSDGNVGIGTTSPNAKLHIDKSNTNSSVIISRSGNNIAASTGVGSITFPAHYNSSYTDYAAIQAYSNNLSSVRGSLDLKVKSTSGNLLTGLTVYGTSSGANVGIGTTSPSEKLVVDGNAKINDALISNQENTDIDTGVEVVGQVVKATYTAAFFDFVIKKGTNVRSGTVYACHDGTNVEFTETSTNDLGDTSDVVLSVDISGTNMRLLATVASDDWSVKTLIRAI